MAKNYGDDSKNSNKKRKRRESSKIIVGKESSKSQGWKQVGSKEVKKSISVQRSSTASSSRGVGNSDSSGSRMESGAKAGLQTADEVLKDTERKRLMELENLRRDQEAGLIDTSANTVYRDISGQQIDVSETKKKQESEAALEKSLESKRLRDLNKGSVQLQQEARYKQNLAKEANRPLEQHRNDFDRDQELRKRRRADDPAANFLSSASDPVSVEKEFTDSGRLPTFSGPYAANRFNIVPGIKWDGVDRSNGFETRWLKRAREIQDQKTLRYTTAQDD